MCFFQRIACNCRLLCTLSLAILATPFENNITYMAALGGLSDLIFAFYTFGVCVCACVFEDIIAWHFEQV